MSGKRPADFASQFVIEDDEPLLEIADVIRAMKDVFKDTPFESTKEYERIMEAYKIDPYILFDTEFYSGYRESEVKADAERDRHAMMEEVEDYFESCNGCGSKKIMTSQEQIRSGDEGATTIKECLRCGKTWR